MHLAGQNGGTGPNNLVPNTRSTADVHKQHHNEISDSFSEASEEMLFLQDVKCSNKFYNHSEDKRIWHDLTDIKQIMQNTEVSASVTLLRNVQTDGRGEAREVFQ